MSSRFSQYLVLFAGVLWVFHPALCDFRHLAEEGHVVEHVLEFWLPHDHDDADDGEDSPQLLPGHECCGGHDRSPVVTEAKAKVAENPAKAVLVFGMVLSSWSQLAVPLLTPHSLIDMAGFFLSQGNPCALFCRWII